jgi:hypothetical protein
MVGASMLAFDYLQEARRSAPPETLEEALKRYETRIQNQLDPVLADVAALKRRGTTQPIITDAERREIVARSVSNISEDAVAAIAEEWDRKLRASALEDKHIDLIRQTATEMRSRLREEVAALGRRSNLNLTIGFFISMIGLLALAWFVITTAGELREGTSATEIALRFSVRLSLVVFIEILAYFFLRLYRYGIYEIKYFQNEITGAEFRIIALEAALKSSEKGILDKVCSEMARMETNFVLKKDETTVALRQEEHEAARDRFLASSLEQLIDLKKPAA